MAYKQSYVCKTSPTPRKAMEGPTNHQRVHTSCVNCPIYSMSQKASSRSTNFLGSRITFTRSAVGKCCYQAGHSYSAKSPVRFQATVSHNRINDDLKITHDDSTFNSWLSRCDPNQNLVYMCNRSDEAFSFWWFLVPMKCVLNVSQIHFECATRVFQVTSKAFSEQFFCVSNASPLMVDLYQGCISDACLLHIKWISVASFGTSLFKISVE